MQLLNVEQGTDEWLALRKNYFTASEAPAVMGAGLYEVKTPNDLVAQKQGRLNSQPYAPALQHGHDREPHIRKRCEALLGESFVPQVCVEGRYLRSSDGLNMDQNIDLEIKAPYSPKSKILQAARKGEILDAHRWQLDHSLLVTGCEKVVFAVEDAENNDVILIDYLPDLKRREQLIEGWQRFAELMKEKPIETSVIADDLAPTIQSYLMAKDEVERATEFMHAIRSQILNELDADKEWVAPNQTLVVKTVTPKTKTDYKKLVTENLDLLKNVDFEQYKKQPKPYQTISDKRKNTNG